MSQTKQVGLVVREDYEPLLRAANRVIHDVMVAGEKQRVDAGLDTNGWMAADPVKRLNNVLHHILACHHAGHLKSLTDNTYLEEWKHALTGLVIIAYHELNPEPGLVIEPADED